MTEVALLLTTLLIMVLVLSKQYACVYISTTYLARSLREFEPKRLKQYLH